MGVSGTGKSTLGTALARSLNMPYIEGDDLHPASNVRKMSSGIPLTDADREPWLKLIRTTAEHVIAEQQLDEDIQKLSGVVISCSALKRYYRDILRGEGKSEGHTLARQLERPDRDVLPTYFVFIDGSRDILLERMEKRPGHFMKASMLDSQLNTLESPVEEEGVISVSLQDDTESQVRVAREGLSRLIY